jgi:hypothetical protein
MLLASVNGGLGIAVNEIQRSLGDVPNDAEAAYDLQYTPVRQGWYVGYPVTGGGYESSNRCSNGFGEGAAPSTPMPVEVPPTKREKLAIGLQMAGTLAVVTVATVAVVRAFTDSKHRGTAFGRRRRR